MRLLTLIASVVVAFAVAAGSARADDDATRIAADSLFDQAKELITKGDIAKACEKLEASQKMLPRLGTQLNLADCYQKQNRTATAWAEFRAASVAGKGDPRSDFAKQRAAELGPTLTRVEIDAAGTPPAGLAVKRDGAPLDLALLGTPVPVDPGKHTITASAPGKQDWSTEIDAEGAGNTVTVPLPELQPAGAVAPKPTPPVEHPKPTPPPPKPAPPPPPKPTPATQPAVTPPPPVETTSAPGARRRTAGLAVGIGGAIAIGIGGYLGLSAKSEYDDAHGRDGGCDANTHCDTAGYDNVEDALSRGNVATVLFIAGAAAIATGVILYATAPRARERLAIAPAGAGLVVVGAF